MRAKLAIASAVIVGTAGVAASSAQGSGEALPGLPSYTKGFQNWTRINSKPIPPRASGDAHLGVKNVYVNQTKTRLAPGGKQRFPMGAKKTDYVFTTFR